MICWRLLLIMAALRVVSTACLGRRPAMPLAVPTGDLEVASTEHVKRTYYLPPTVDGCPEGQRLDHKGHCKIQHM